MLDLAYCPVCRRETGVETAPCPDGHGSECPERICVSCAAVIMVGPLPGRGASAA